MQSNVPNYIVDAVQVAMDLALVSRENGMKHCHGALAFKKGKIVGHGFNSRGSSWLQRLYANALNMIEKKYEHAEVAAIRRSQSADSLLVVRVNSNEELVNSKPCAICRALIEDSKIKHLYYSGTGELKYERIWR